MTRRGRPPHPDVLTPREWEVLALLREGLSDQTIADRLDISLDGAKYHVREILSKLGVASRQDAAAWQPETPASARRWLALPVALRIAGALVMVAAVGGLGLLAWGVARTNTDSEGPAQLAGPSPATPELGMHLTRDQALMRALGGPSSEITFVDAQPSTIGEILLFQDGPPPTGSQEPLGYRSQAPAWLVTTRGMFDQSGGGLFSRPIVSTFVPEIACREVSSFFRDDPSDPGTDGGPLGGGGGGKILDESLCQREDLTRDMAILLAARAVWTYDGESEPPVPTAEQMTLGEAMEAVKDRARSSWQSIDKPERTPIWLVILRGRFLEPEGEQPADGTPRPTTLVSCADRSVILDVASHEVIYLTKSGPGPCN